MLIFKSQHFSGLGDTCYSLHCTAAPTIYYSGNYTHVHTTFKALFFEHFLYGSPIYQRSKEYTFLRVHVFGNALSWGKGPLNQEASKPSIQTHFSALGKLTLNLQSVNHTRQHWSGPGVQKKSPDIFVWCECVNISTTIRDDLRYGLAFFEIMLPKVSSLACKKSMQDITSKQIRVARHFCC